MRTTVNVSEELLAAARRRAVESGQTLGSVIEAALRRELAAATEPADAPEVPVFRGGTGPLPGLDLRSNRSVLEAMDAGTPAWEAR